MKWFIVSSQLGGWFTKSFHWADASCLIWVEKSGSRFRFLGVFKSRLSFVSSSTPRQVSKIGCGTARKKQTPRQETGEMTVKWETGEEQVSPWKTFSKFSRLLPGTRVSVGDFCFSAPTLRANKRGEREMRGGSWVECRDTEPGRSVCFWWENRRPFLLVVHFKFDENSMFHRILIELTLKLLPGVLVIRIKFYLNNFKLNG